ncbi:MAG: hypothetical protein K2I06_09230, partial [Ruminococcus sp.]|nr:hypothetical protein [Ruminococcus sp.]
FDHTLNRLEAFSADKGDAYLKSLKFLPEGVSILSRSEIETADINGDGVVDNGDVIEYLSFICK